MKWNILKTKKVIKISEIKVYLAGAMEAHEGTDYAKQWRDTVKEYFNKFTENIEVISPTDYYEYGKNYNYTEMEVFNFDLRKVKESNVILVDLNNIRKSIGTCMELKEAYTYNIPVIGFLDSELQNKDIIQLIHPWVYCCCDRIETGTNSIKKAISYIKDYYQ